MDSKAIDSFLAAALRDPPARWPEEWEGDPVAEEVVERTFYHGIAGLMVDIGAPDESWPAELRRRIREQAVAQAMWEARHQIAIAELLAALAERGLDALLLKGTAVAYDLYENPSARQRGDTDLLVRASQLGAVRKVLEKLGFVRSEGDGLPDRLKLQEGWSMDTLGLSHHLDLHWTALNAITLRNVLSFDELYGSAVPLPRLCDGALAPDRPSLLLHTCLHRAMHLVAPYQVDGMSYYGGDRLIWLQDIHLLAGSLSDAQWERFMSLARSTGTAPVCAGALASAHDRLGTGLPENLLTELSAAPPNQSGRYLQSGQFRRGVKDVLGVPGLGDKARLIIARLVPPADFLREKYPSMANRPTAVLYARRMVELFRKRPSEGKRQ